MSTYNINQCYPKFWGETDTNIQFCGDKYNITPYISEFHNTWSNIFFILFPLTLLNKNCDKVLIYTSSCIGIGSTIFHATTRYYGEFLDEFAIFLTLIIYILKLSKLYKLKTRHWYSDIIALIYMLFFLYIMTHSYIYFNLATITGVLVVFLQLRHYYKHTKNNDFKKLSIRSMYLMITGKILWLIDQYYLNNDKCHEQPWVIICHPLWHFFAASSIYYLILIDKLINNMPVQ
jgi:uncharacterized protein with PQ loop repeat